MLCYKTLVLLHYVYVFVAHFALRFRFFKCFITIGLFEIVGYFFCRVIYSWFRCPVVFFASNNNWFNCEGTSFSSSAFNAPLLYIAIAPAFRTLNGGLIFKKYDPIPITRLAAYFTLACRAGQEEKPISNVKFCFNNHIFSLPNDAFIHTAITVCWTSAVSISLFFANS